MQGAWIFSIRQSRIAGQAQSSQVKASPAKSSRFREKIIFLCGRFFAFCKIGNGCRASILFLETGSIFRHTHRLLILWM
jgi:hypothetical protein